MKLALTIATVSLVGLLTIFGAAPYSRTSAAAMAAPDAAQTFGDKCASCHGKDGQAKGFKAKAKGARNLTDADWQGRVTDERIFNSISNGKGKMPAFSKKLSEAEINDLVQYVRSLKR